MIRTFPVTCDVAAIALAATAVIYVGHDHLPVDPKSVAIGLDDAFVVPLDIVADEAPDASTSADISAIAERLRCPPDYSALRRILHLACAQIAEELRAEAETARQVPEQRATEEKKPSMDDLLRRMDAVQMNTSVHA